MKKKVRWNQNLIDIVNDWLKENRPKWYVDDRGTIGLVEEKGLQSQAFGTTYLGGVGDTYVEFLNPFEHRRGMGLETTVIEAADPEFFEKLAKHLPPKL